MVAGRQLHTMPRPTQIWMARQIRNLTVCGHLTGYGRVFWESDVLRGLFCHLARTASNLRVGQRGSKI